MPKEYLKIDPIEELLKGIAIVHGQAYADRLQRIMVWMTAESQKALNAVPWTRERIQYVLDNEVRYKDWHFVVDERLIAVESDQEEYETDLRLRAEWVGRDAVTENLELQQSRWWPLSVHMCKTEIIQTAFLCVMKAEEHEIRETFQYKGKAPFHTHIDVDTLAGVSDSVDVRVDPRPEAPKNQRRE